MEDNKNKTKVDLMYDDLYEQGYLEKDRDTFNQFFFAPGEQGYKNRKALYDDLHEQGYLESPTYEDFAKGIGLYSVQQGAAQGGQAVTDPQQVGQQAVQGNGRRDMVESLDKYHEGLQVQNAPQAPAVTPTPASSPSFGGGGAASSWKDGQSIKTSGGRRQQKARQKDLYVDDKGNPALGTSEEDSRDIERSGLYYPLMRNDSINLAGTEAFRKGWLVQPQLDKNVRFAEARAAGYKAQGERFKDLSDEQLVQAMREEEKKLDGSTSPESLQASMNVRYIETLMAAREWGLGDVPNFNATPYMVDYYQVKRQYNKNGLVDKYEKNMLTRRDDNPLLIRGWELIEEQYLKDEAAGNLRDASYYRNLPFHDPKFAEEFGAYITARIKVTGERWNDAVKDAIDDFEAAAQEGRVGQRHSEEYLGSANREQVDDMLDRVNSALKKRTGELDDKFMNKSWFQRLGESSYDPESPSSRYLTDPDASNLIWAGRALQDAKKIIAAFDANRLEDGLTGFFKGAGRGLVDSLGDLSTWDGGISDLLSAQRLNAAVDKFKKGKPLSASEKALLDATSLKLATAEIFKEVGRGYKAGTVTGESLPFMVEMALNPIAKSGNKIASGLAKYANKYLGKYLKKMVSKLGRSSAGRMATRILGSGLAKNAGRVTARVVGDIGAAGGMAATSGLGHSAASAIGYHTGDVQYQQGAGGKTHFSGVTGGDDWVTSTLKGFGSTTIENASEMWGEYFKPITNFLGSVSGKALEKMHLGAITRWLNDVNSTEMARLMSDFRKQTRWDGNIAEYFEEVAGNIANALTVGDMNFSLHDKDGNISLHERNSVFNVDDNLDTFLGVSLMSGAMGSANIVGYRTPKYRAKQDVKRYGDMARGIFGARGNDWSTIESLIQDNSEDGRKQFVADLMQSGKYSQREKQAALQYAGAVYKSMGMDLGESKQKRSAGEQEAEEAYGRGYDMANLETIAETSSAYNQLRSQMEREYGTELMERMDSEPGLVYGWVRAGAVSEEDAKKVLDYLNAKMAYEGAVDRLNDDDSAAKAAAESHIDDQVYTEENGGDGQIHPVTLKGREGDHYVVSGNVVTDNDGNVDVDASDNEIVVVDSNGKRMMTTAKDIAQVGDTIDPNAAKAQAVASIESVSAQVSGGLDTGANQIEGDETLDGTDLDSDEVAAPDGATQQDASSIQAPLPVAEYNQDDLVTVEVDGQQVDGIVTNGLDSNGNVTLYLEEPINGRQNVQLTPEQLNQVAVSYTSRDGETIDRSVREEESGESGETPQEPQQPGAPAQEQTPVSGESEKPLQQPAANGELDVQTGETPQTPNAPVAEAPQQAPAQPSLPVGEDGNADFSNATTQEAHDYIYNDPELDEDEANQVVQNYADSAAEELAKAQAVLDELKSMPAPQMKDYGRDMAGYKRDKKERNDSIAQAQAAVDAAQREVDLWNGVQAQHMMNRAAAKAAANRTKESVENPAAPSAPSAPASVSGESENNAPTPSQATPPQGQQTTESTQEPSAPQPNEGNGPMASTSPATGVDTQPQEESNEGEGEDQDPGDSGESASPEASGVETRELTPDERIERARMEALENRAEELADSCGLPVQVARSLDDLSDRHRREVEKQHAEGKYVNGFYDPMTKQIVLFLPDIAKNGGLRRLERTFLHEGVAHGGLRALFENAQNGIQTFDELCDQVWEMMPVAAQASMMNYIGVQKPEDMTQEKKRIAADEYMAHLAEWGVEPSVKTRIITAIKNALRKIGVKMKLSNSDIVSLLAASRRNLNEMDKVAINSAISEDLDNDGEGDGEGVRMSTSPTFYSNAERAVENIKQNKATAEQWKAMLTKAGGIKSGEDKWMGLSQWLEDNKGKSLSKDEVMQFIKDNSIEMVETTYGEVPQSFDSLKREYDQWLHDEGFDYAQEQLRERFGDDADIAFDDLGGELVVANEEVAAAVLGSENIINSTRLDYTTEGLEDKREIAFKVPNIEPYQEHDEIHFGPENQGKAVMWVRFGETTDADGNRVLVIDEIQSNRHQDARENGYINAGELERLRAEYAAIKKERDDLLDGILPEGEKWNIRERSYALLLPSTPKEVRDRYYKLDAALNRKLSEINEFNRRNQSKVPAAPFEKNWHEVAMKRMLRLAAEEGFDKVAWTTGEQQAKRYDLSKQVDEIVYKKNEDGTYRVSAITGGRGNLLGESIATNELPEIVGRDLSQKIVSNEGKKTPVSGRASGWKTEEWTSLAGEDLKIGGEGMKGFYDQMLPRFMDKYGKKWGVKTGEVELSTPGKEVMHAVDVTPEMKESVMQGQPLFSSTLVDENSTLEETNENFNKELGAYENGTLPSNTLLAIGYPKGVLAKAIPSKPIVLRQKVLTKALKKHGLEVSDVKNLPSALADPIFIFKSSAPTISILTELQSKDGKNVFVAIELDATKQFGHEFLEVNDVLTIHGREEENIVKPILKNDSLVWVDKEKGHNWLSSAKSNSQAITNDDLDIAAKIIQDFDNSKFEKEKAEKSSETTENGENMLMSTSPAEVSEEEREVLMGIHNITAAKLRSAIGLGGLANPSMAVVDTTKGLLNNFGEISLIPGRDLIDKRKGRNAGTFTADAYTPRFPTVHRRLGKGGEKKLSQWIKSLGMRSEMEYNTQEQFNDWVNGFDIQANALVYPFLHEKGLSTAVDQEDHNKVSAPFREIVGRHHGDINALMDAFDTNEEVRQEITDIIIDDIVKQETQREEGESWKEYRDRRRKWRQLVNEAYLDFAGFVDRGIARATLEKECSRYVEASRFNPEATRQAASIYIDKNGMRSEYTQWREQRFAELGVEEQMYAGSDSQGRSKYKPITLEGVSRAMKKQGLAGGESKFFSLGPGGIRARLAPRLNSLNQIRAERGRIQSDIDSILKDYSEELDSTISNLFGGDREAAVDVLTSADMKAKAKELGYEIGDGTVRYIEDFKQRVMELPTEYFETKFERPVMLNEFEAAVVPNDVDSDIREALETEGLDVREYDPELAGDRERVTIKAAQDSGKVLFSASPTFYSNAERAVENIKQNKATAEQWKAMLTKAGGIKAGEDKWMGLSEWLDENKGKPLTKDEVLQFVRDNGIEMEEREYSVDGEYETTEYIPVRHVEVGDLSYVYKNVNGDIVHAPFSMSKDFVLERGGKYIVFRKERPVSAHDSMVEAVDALNAVYEKEGPGKRKRVHVTDEINPTRMDYTTAGLDDYREVAFVLPGVEPYQEGDEIHFGPENQGKAVMWVRFGETTDADGKRVLVIDEIQSNRHQDAREKGYRRELTQEDIALENNDPAVWTVGRRGANGNLVAMMFFPKAKYSRYGAMLEYLRKHPYIGDIPAAPFEKNWHEVAMKRMLRLAAEEGFDKVAWTTGEQQAERYNIGNVVNRIVSEPYEAQSPTESNGHDLFVALNDGTMYEMFVQPDGTLNSNSEMFDGKNVREVFGKELGEKIATTTERTELEGDGLRIGGEGMKGFYDQMLPRFMDKYGKRWGVKTGEVQLATPGKEVMHSVDVTPEMKESVMQGQPLFSTSDVNEAMPRNTEQEREVDGDLRFSVREKPEPKKTIPVYKLMRLGDDGKLYPLFIDGTEPIELGVWYDADSPNMDMLVDLPIGVHLIDTDNGTSMTMEEYVKQNNIKLKKGQKYPPKEVIESTSNGQRWVYIEPTERGQRRFGGESRRYWNLGINGSGSVSTFSMRPGWHAGSLPTMRQIGKGAKKNLRDDRFVWVEGLISADVDYNEEAQRNPDNDIPTHIPTDGFYLKATNANAKASQADRVGWYISGAFMPVKIMSDSEARQVIDKWNADPKHADLQVEYDFPRESGKVFNAETMQLEDEANVRFSTGWHGSGSEFDQFDHSHMGEGEGAQAYGWGTYITSVEGIGRSYATESAKKNPTYYWKGQQIDRASINPLSMAYDVVEREGTIKKAISLVDRFLDNPDAHENWAEVKEILKQSKKSDFTKKPARYLYEVEIPDNNGENYISWNETLPKKHRRRIAAVVRDLSDDLLQRNTHGPNWLRGGFEQLANTIEREQYAGKEITEKLRDALGSSRAVSEIFSKAGFVGTEYPAQYLSGGRKDGAKNYVIYNEDDVEIKDRIRFSTSAAVDALKYDERVYNDLLGKVFSGVSNETRRGIVEDAMRNRGNDFGATTEAWLGGLADDGKFADVDRRDWGKVKLALHQALMDNGVDVSEPLSDGESRYVLWKAGQIEDGVFSMAEDVVMRDRLLNGARAPQYTDSADVRFSASPAKQIYSDNFKNWFGDWENDPEHASKVVDKGGRPLVVYHGTPKGGFYVFDTKEGKKGKSKMQLDFGSHFTPNEEQASEYQGKNQRNKNRKVYPVYLDLKNPIDVTQDGEHIILSKPLTDDPSYASSVHPELVDALHNVLTKQELKKYRLNDSYNEVYNLWNMLNDMSPKRAREVIEALGFDGVKYDARYQMGGLVAPGYKNERRDVSYIALRPEQIKSATDNNGDFSRENPDIRFSTSAYDVIKAAREAASGEPQGNGYINSTYHRGEIAEGSNAGEKYTIRISDHPAKWDNFVYSEDEDLDGRVLSIVITDDLEYINEWKGRGLDEITDRDGYDVEQYILNADDVDTDMLTAAIENFKKTGRSYGMKDGEMIGIQESGDGIQFSVTPRDRAIARGQYERWMKSGRMQWLESMQDSMLGLKKLMQAIMGNAWTKVEDVAMYENPYIAENLMSSVTAAQQQAFYTEFMKPLLEEVGKLCKGGKKAREKAREELTNYLMAKHGLERNQVLADRDAQETAQAGGNYQDAYAENRERDYSGLTALTGEDDVHAAEAKAQQMVDDYEAQHDTTELWSKINAATQVTLEKQYKSGILSYAEYQRISGMFDYYVPLRGWEETTSDQVYGYLTSKAGPFLGGGIVKRAEGRTSKADDPIATIAQMGDDSIRTGNRNLMKQTFLNFVQNHPSDLVSVSDLWLQYDAVTDEWVPVFADIDPNDSADVIAQKIDAFEQHMQQLANQEPDKYKHGREAANIPYRVIPGMEKEHQVLVKRNGQTWVLTINGNPRAAQALNGLTNPDVPMEGAWASAIRGAEWVNRTLSALYTTLSPAFIVSNFLRDSGYSNTMVWVRESPNYALRFNKNYLKLNPATLRFLLGRWENGTLDESKPLQKHFKEFMLNGGETGFAMVKDIDKYKKDLLNEVKNMNSRNFVRKGMKVLGSQYELLGRSIENCARFAAYVTSREMGRDVKRSAYDAKEISVNFNKKGSGGKSLGKVGQTMSGNVGAFVSGMARSLYTFWNAGVQGMTNAGRAVKRHPVKAALMGAAPLYAAGFLAPILAQMMGAGGDGDDDKNAYYNLPEYVRRSNLCIWLGDAWLTIPLPIEFRSIYGMGELTYGVISGNERYSDYELAMQIIGQFSQLLPIDMLEGGGFGFHPFIPTLFKPIVEAEQNKSWSGLPIYRSSEWNKDEPEYTKAFSNANEWIVSGAEWLNTKTGGDEFKKGWIDLNPAKIEYMLKGYLGGIYTTIDEVRRAAETALGERDFEWRNIPLANRVIKQGDERTESKKLRDEYFNYKEDYEETKRLINKYKNAEDTDLFDYAKKIDLLNNSKEYGRYLIFEKYSTMLEAYQKAKKGASGEVLKKIEEDEKVLMRQLVDEMHAFEDGKITVGNRPKLSKKDRSEDYGYMYNMLRTYVDINEDALLDSALKRAKAADDKGLVAALNSIKRSISEMKKGLGRGKDEEVMNSIRQMREGVLRSFGLLDGGEVEPEVEPDVPETEEPQEEWGDEVQDNVPEPDDLDYDDLDS